MSVNTSVYETPIPNFDDLPEVSRRTIHELDGDFPLPEPSSSLEQWYVNIRDIPVSNMELFDLGRACRQQICLEAVVPVILSYLRENPIASDLFEGELLLNLTKLPKDFWQAHLEEWKLFESIGRGFLAIAEVVINDPEWQAENLTEDIRFRLRMRYG